MNTELITPLLFELLAKSGAILLIAAFVVRVWRNASAAQRHLVWLAAILTVLLLPMTRLVAPRWPVQIEQRMKREVPSTVFSFAPIAVASVPSGGPVAEVRRTSWELPDWRWVVLVGWLAGSALLLGWRLIGSCRLFLLKRASRPLQNTRVEALASRVLRDLRIGRRVAIRLSDECRVPMTWGSLRPVLMLPVEALEWSDTRLTAALRHEAGHISRHDYLTRCIANLACAVYWPNPVVWLAARALRVAQEHATDDIVLRAGTPTDDYAAQLFDVARTVVAEGFLARHAVAMASPSTLEGRVLAIVDEKRNRRPLSRWAAASGITAVLAALTLSSVAQLSGGVKKEQPPKSEPSTAEPNAKELQVVIESKFLEIPDGAVNSAAMPWLPAISKSVPIQGALAGVLTEEQAQAAWKTLNETKGVDLLSAPRVTTRSKQRATIEIIREFRYPTEWAKDTKPSTWKPEAFETKNVGVTLGVEATVNEGGIIDLNLTPEVVEFLGFKDLDAGGKAVSPKPDPSKPMSDRLMDPPTGAVAPGHRSQPIFSTRKIDTTVSVAAGQTVVMELGSADVEQVVEAPARKGAKKPETAKSRRRLLVFVSAKIVKPVIVEKSVTITSDSQTFDKTTGAVTASGNVKIETPQAVIMAEKAEIKPKAAEGAAPTSVMLEKVPKIIFPKIEFREATLREVIDFLKRKAVDLDPEHKGVNIILRGPENADARITLSLTDIPLGEALKYVAGLANYKSKVEPYAIALLPQDDMVDEFVTKEWKTVPDLIPPLPSGKRESAREWLVAQGVVFNGPASATYIPTTSRLIVRNTQDQLDLIDAIVENSMKGSKPDARTLQPPGSKPVEAQKPPVPVGPAPSTPAAALMERANRIVIPKLEFREATLDEGVEFLRKKSIDLDPDKQGVNIVVKHSKESPEARITVSLTEIPLSEALRYVAQLAGLDVSVDENAFVIAAKPAP